MPPHEIHLWKIALLLVVASLALMPAPVHVSCFLPASAPAPQPLPEPCDPVLMSAGGVSVSTIVHDIALAILAVAAPTLIGLLWRDLTDQRVSARAFNPIPDPPPPRSFTA